MEKGYIENILEETVCVIFDNKSRKIFPLNIFPRYIKQDMVVYFEKEKLIKVEKRDKEIEKKIEMLSKELFTPFNNKKTH